MELTTQPQNTGGVASANVGGNPFLKQMNFSRVVKPPAIKIAQATSKVCKQRQAQMGDIYQTNTGGTITPFGQEFFFVLLYFSNILVTRGYKGNRLNDKKVRGALADVFTTQPLTSENAYLINRDNKEVFIDPSTLR